MIIADEKSFELERESVMTIPDETPHFAAGAFDHVEL